MAQHKLTIRRISKTSIKDIIKDVDAHHMSIKAGLWRMAEQVRLKLIETIDNNRKRAKKKDLFGKKSLKDSIAIYPISSKDGTGYGIGKISVLNKETPYWSVLNFGGYVPPPNLGFWDGSSPPKDAWTHTGNKGDFLLIPKKSIEGIHYIGKTAGWLNLNWTKFWDKYFRNRKLKLPVKY